MASLNLFADPVALTAALIDIESPSHHEREIADAIEAQLRELPAVEVIRGGNTVVARTHHGHAQRVVLAGHVDTVPLAGNTPHRLEGDVLYGLSLIHI